jgi:hypothetical protein
MASDAVASLTALDFQRDVSGDLARPLCVPQHGTGELVGLGDPAGGQTLTSLRSVYRPPPVTSNTVRN